MKLRVRSSATKHRKKTGYRTRQKTKGGRKVNARQRRRKAGRGKSHPT
jgi:ribosomal protein L34